MARLSSLLLLLALAGSDSPASQRLLFFEAQAVGGYSFTEDEIRWYSMHQMDVMQKPSIGFDLLQRFSGRYGDWGALAVQARLAYDSTRKHDIEPQLYNVFLKLKPAIGDFWLGHNKPAFGLSSTLDNHGTLLQPLSMYGYGYDRDWGAGYYRDLDWGNASLSATLGSGMPLFFYGNRLFSARAAWGDLNRDNFSLGLSATYGKALEAMGYHLMSSEPVEQALGGFDGSWRWNNLELRADLLAGRRHAASVHAALCRASLALLSEDRLRAEVQQVYAGDGNVGRYHLAAGLSWSVTSSLAARAIISAYRPGYGREAAAQLYWYRNL